MQKPSSLPPSTARPTVFVEHSRNEPGCLAQSLWFLFVGWWLAALVVSVAWFLNVTIIGLPIGLMILNNVPKIVALQGTRRHLTVTHHGHHTSIRETGDAQIPIPIRAVWFILVGWWWSGVWMFMAYMACLTLVLLPIGLAMFRLTPAMTTLRRY